MKKCAILSFIILTLTFSSCKEDFNSNDEKRTLLVLEERAISREFQLDTTFLSSIMDSTFIELNNGKIKGKHEVLRTIYKNRKWSIDNDILIDSFKIENPVVNIYNNAAVVTFVLQTYGRNKQTPNNIKTQFYDVWIKRPDGWKAVAWHASEVGIIK